MIGVWPLRRAAATFLVAGGLLAAALCFRAEPAEAPTPVHAGDASSKARQVPADAVAGLPARAPAQEADRRRRAFVRCVASDGGVVLPVQKGACGILLHCEGGVERSLPADVDLAAAGLTFSVPVVADLRPRAITALVPGWLPSTTSWDEHGMQLTLVAEAAAEMRLHGLPDGFLGAVALHLELVCLGADDGDLLAHPDGSRTLMRFAPQQLTTPNAVVRGLPQGISLAACLKEAAHGAVLAEFAFRAPCTVDVAVDASRFVPIRCDRRVDGVVCARDRTATPEKWLQVVQVREGAGWIMIPKELTSEARWIAWGAGWKGKATALPDRIAIAVEPSSTVRLRLTGPPLPRRYELYGVDQGRLLALGDTAGEDEPAAADLGDSWVLRGLAPGSFVVVRHVPSHLLRVAEVAGPGEIEVSMAHGRTGVLRDGPQVHRQVARTYPGRSLFDLFARLRVDGRFVDIPLDSWQTDQAGEERAADPGTWRMPELPVGGSFVARVTPPAAKFPMTTEIALAWTPDPAGR